jgi:hypothetical protein
MAVLAVASHVREVPPPVLGALAVAFGALLFAGSLTEGGRDGWIGLPVGAACAALAWYASVRFFTRARSRLATNGDGPRSLQGAGLLDVYGDLVALSIALVSIVIPPLAFGAVAAFLMLLIRGRAAEGRKYEGLRILR